MAARPFLLRGRDHQPAANSRSSLGAFVDRQPAKARRDARTGQFEIAIMKDKELETKLRLLTLQLDNWKKLHYFITDGLDRAKPIVSVEQKLQFTEIRAQLLQETEHIFKKLNTPAELSGKVMNV